MRKNAYLSYVTTVIICVNRSRMVNKRKLKSADSRGPRRPRFILACDCRDPHGPQRSYFLVTANGQTQREFEATKATAWNYREICPDAACD
jgi:hypothetical protein